MLMFKDINLSDINLVIYKCHTTDDNIINSSITKNYNKLYVNIKSIGFNYHSYEWIIYNDIDEGSYNYLENIDKLNISELLKDKINKKIYNLLGIDNKVIYKIVNPDNSISIAF